MNSINFIKKSEHFKNFSIDKNLIVKEEIDNKRVFKIVFRGFKINLVKDFLRKYSELLCKKAIYTHLLYSHWHLLSNYAVIAYKTKHSKLISKIRDSYYFNKNSVFKEYKEFLEQNYYLNIKYDLWYDIFGNIKYSYGTKNIKFLENYINYELNLNLVYINKQEDVLSDSDNESVKSYNSYVEPPIVIEEKIEEKIKENKKENVEQVEIVCKPPIEIKTENVQEYIPILVELMEKMYCMESQTVFLPARVRNSEEFIKEFDLKYNPLMQRYNTIREELLKTHVIEHCCFANRHLLSIVRV